MVTRDSDVVFECPCCAECGAAGGHHAGCVNCDDSDEEITSEWPRPVASDLEVTKEYARPIIRRAPP